MSFSQLLFNWPANNDCFCMHAAKLRRFLGACAMCPCLYRVNWFLWQLEGPCTGCAKEMERQKSTNSARRLELQPGTFGSHEVQADCAHCCPLQPHPRLPCCLSFLGGRGLGLEQGQGEFATSLPCSLASVVYSDRDRTSKIYCSGYFQGGFFCLLLVF